QATRLIGWASAHGIMPGSADIKDMAQQALGSFGKVTAFLGSAVGAVASVLLVLVIGLFVAIAPRLYDRGLQWLVPQDMRGEFAITIDRMAHT
ncbi:hypothetical protein ABTM83_19225, partial [Acinetobacter baumannii]